jgi:hypothetical protein
MPEQDPSTQITESVEELWGIPLQPAGCRKCGQAHLVDASRLGQVCPNCANGKLEAQPARLRAEPPELLVPYRKTQAEFRLVLENFTRPVWLAVDDFTIEKLLQRAMPIYWPMWLVDSNVFGAWQAEVGFDYQVKSSQESYIGNGWQTREVIETRQRWEPRAGQIARHYDNIHVPALTDHARLVGLVGEYQLNQAVPYDTAKLRKSILRIPDLLPESAWPQAQANLDRAAAAECQKAAAVKYIRNFSVKADYQEQHWTQLLLPMLVSYYTDDDGKAHPVFINGQSGVVGGVRLASQRKGWKWAGITAGIAAQVLMISLLLLAAGAVIPPLLAVGGVGAFIAIVLVFAAIVPAVWPWWWNRKTEK